MSKYRDLVTIDGLIVSRLGRDVFEDMRLGGLTAANCTCSVWENFEGTMRRVAECKRLIEDNSDLVLQVYTTDDVVRAKKENKTGIFLGWQNTSGIEDYIPYLQLFHELGVRVMQLTYNTQNLLGSGCYESKDGGLSDFGREAIDEMNRLGILIDLSHVGPVTADDAIRHSKRPVCYSHVAPSALKQHPRCKSDEQLRFIADRGGFVGATPFPPFMAKGPDATIDDFVDVLEHMIRVVGEDRIGFGSDFSQGNPYTPDYWVRDKGYARQLVDFGTLKYPDGLDGSATYPNLVTAFERRGWSDRRIEGVIGGNWLSFLKEVWFK
jgi:membrane dipeptidase